MSRFVRKYARRLGVVSAVGALTLATVGTQVASADVTGDFAGGADADLVEVSAVAIPPACGEEPLLGLTEPIPCQLEIAELVVGDSEASSDNDAALTLESLNRSGLNSFGHASQLDPDVLTQDASALVDEELLTGSNAFKAGGPTRDSDEILNIDNELLSVSLAQTEASALDVGAGNTTCPDFQNGRATLSHGRNDTVGLKVGGSAGPAGAGALLAVQDENDVSYAESRTELVDSLVGTTGDNAHGVESTATVELAPVSLLGDAVTVNVIHPTLVGRNDGQDFSFDYQTPVVTINGDTVVDGQTLEALEGVDLEAGVLNLTVDIANAEDVQVSGNQAVVSDVVKLSLTAGAPEGTGSVEIATISIGDLNVLAETPQGGVKVANCDGPPQVRERPPAERPPADEGLPRTGGGSLAIAGLGVLLATAGALRRRRS